MIKKCAGIDSATSKYPCICASVQRMSGTILRKYGLLKTAHMVHVQSKKMFSSAVPQESNGSMSAIHHCFPPSPSKIYNLHLFLRVEDVLIDLLITELKRHDCIEKQNKFKSFDSTANKL